MSFLQSTVEYLEYRIDAAGLHATTAKIDAILNVPTPADVHQLRKIISWSDKLLWLFYSKISYCSTSPQ